MSDSVEREWGEGTIPQWIDTGSGGGYEPREQIDLSGRPAYAPAALVIEVKRVLAAAGIHVDPDQNMMFTAGIAAADLLRALGVRPEIAPMRGGR